MTEPTKPTIVCKYTCALCGLRRVDCTVDAREPGEDVVTFMDRTVLIVVEDHERRSPGCKPKALAELLIPQGSDGSVGTPVIVH